MNIEPNVQGSWGKKLEGKRTRDGKMMENGLGLSIAIKNAAHKEMWNGFFG